MYKASVDLQLPYVRLTARESTAGESGFIPATSNLLPESVWCGSGLLGDALTELEDEFSGGFYQNSVFPLQELNNSTYEQIQKNV